MKNSFAIIIVASMLLCSCASDYRTQVAKGYRLSDEMTLNVKGKWHNAPKASHERTLWEYLTLKEAPTNAMVALEMSDKQTLTATLLTDGKETDSRTITFKRRAPWLELPTQHIAHPLLWYLIWGWESQSPAIGFDADGDLCAYINYHGGSLMILILPTVGGGGGRGITWYERME